MVGQSGVAFVTEQLRGAVDFVAGQAINDAAVAIMFRFNKIQ